MHGPIEAAAPAAVARPDTRSVAPEEFLTDVGNMLKAFIGLNFMYVAYAFSKAGLVRGIFGLLLIAGITEHCCILLVQVKNAMPGQRPTSVTPAGYSAAGAATSDERGEEGESGGGDGLSEEERGGAKRAGAAEGEKSPPTYGDIGLFVGGKAAQRAVNTALVVTQFGYCVGYLIFISTTLHDMLPQPARDEVTSSWFVLLPLPILVVLALLVSIRSLGPFSIIANAALLFGFVSVVVFIARHYHWHPSSPPLTSLPLFFGQMTAALEGIGLVVPVETSMSAPHKFPLVLRIALGSLTFVLMTVGVIGFANFGAETHSIILLNFGKTPVVALVKAVLVVGILFTYPLQIVPVFQFAESFLAADNTSAADTELDSLHYTEGSESETEGSSLPAPPPSTTATDDGTLAASLFVRDRRKVTIRMAIVTMTAVVAVGAGSEFGLFQSLVGSLGASCLAYTAPALFHLVTFRHELGAGAKAKNVGIVVFGVAVAVVGTVATLTEFARGDDEA